MTEHLEAAEAAAEAAAASQAIFSSTVSLSFAAIDICPDTQLVSM